MAAAMRRTACVAALAAPLLGALLQGSGGAPSGQAPADLVVVNGKVITVDQASTVAEALAIRDGRFVAVGTTADIRQLAGPGTSVIDAGGRAVIPGLIDSHVHALGVAAAEQIQPFRNLASIADVQAWIRAVAASTPDGKWIWTPRVFPTRIHERRFPTRAELDAAAPRHPVVVDGAYALMVNTAALRAASIDASTPNPPGGAIVKGSDGAPTGLLRNVGGMLAAFHHAADENEPSLDALDRVHQAYSRVGITSIGERAASVAGFRVYEALRKAGRLHVRATVTIRIPNPHDPAAADAFVRDLPFKPRAGDDWLKVGPLKIMADGGILAGTAFMREPYGMAARALYGVDDPAYRGFLTLTREQIAAAVESGASRGWQMAAHVTGDAGVDAVLDAFEAAQARHPSPDPRHTLIHAYFVNAETAARAARLGVLVDTQPAWYYKDADALAPALGEGRLVRFIGLRTWLDAGVTTAINTDHMFGLEADTAMNPFNPFLTMATAVTRRSEGGDVIGGDQHVSRMEALRLMTRDAARLSFDESRTGSIEVGKLGDLAILSHDLLACPEDQIKAITVDLTVVGGQVVHDARARRSQ
jgi:predicted amidohydrolase YtcJ